MKITTEESCHVPGIWHMIRFLSHAVAAFDNFSSLETVSLSKLSNIYSNKVVWENVFDEYFLPVPGAF